MAIDESASQDQTIRTSRSEMNNLKQELDTVKKIKDGAIQENRRLQDELCSVTCDCRDARKELELYKRQVDDLKTQLQHYVAEVKRTEDLISNKEIERNELLDQFRSLSHEANILETNNHTLENEATQSKVQLSVALDHASDLERKLENKDSIIQSYEKQIADLTSQIASLEIQLRQCMNQYDKASQELQDMRDLNLKLDNENSRFRRQLRDRDEEKLHIGRNVDQLRSEREVLQHTVTRDRQNVESVEKDLHDAKHQSSELRILNQDLQDEVQRLKHEIQDLKEKLTHCLCIQTPRLPITDQTPELPPDSPNHLTKRPPKKTSETKVLKDEKTEINIRMSNSSTKNRFQEKNKRSHDDNKHGLSTKTESDYVDGKPSDHSCLCLEGQKMHLQKRLSEERQVQDEIQRKQVAKCLVCKRCPVGVSTQEKSGPRSCFTFSGPNVDSYVTNYTLIHETHRAEMSKTCLKK